MTREEIEGMVQRSIEKRGIRSRYIYAVVEDGMAHIAMEFLCNTRDGESFQKSFRYEVSVEPDEQAIDRAVDKIFATDADVYFFERLKADPGYKKKDITEAALRRTSFGSTYLGTDWMMPRYAVSLPTLSATTLTWTIGSSTTGT